MPAANFQGAVSTHGGAVGARKDAARFEETSAHTRPSVRSARLNPVSPRFCQPHNSRARFFGRNQTPKIASRNFTTMPAKRCSVRGAIFTKTAP